MPGPPVSSRRPLLRLLIRDGIQPRLRLFFRARLFQPLDDSFLAISSLFISSYRSIATMLSCRIPPCQRLFQKTFAGMRLRRSYLR
jgi:hypothetical protein